MLPERLEFCSRRCHLLTEGEPQAPEPLETIPVRKMQ